MWPPSRLLSFNKSETVLWTIAKILLYYINGFENFGIHSTFRPHYRILIFQGWAKRKKSRIFVQKSKLYYGSLFNSYYYWIYNSKEISYVSNRFRIHIQSWIFSASPEDHVGIQVSRNRKAHIFHFLVHASLPWINYVIW